MMLVISSFFLHDGVIYAYQVISLTMSAMKSWSKRINKSNSARKMSIILIELIVHRTMSIKGLRKIFLIMNMLVISSFFM